MFLRHNTHVRITHNYGKNKNKIFIIQRINCLLIFGIVYVDETVFLKFENLKIYLKRQEKTKDKIN